MLIRTVLQWLWFPPPDLHQSQSPHLGVYQSKCGGSGFVWRWCPWGVTWCFMSWLGERIWCWYWVDSCRSAVFLINNLNSFMITVIGTRKSFVFMSTLGINPQSYVLLLIMSKPFRRLGCCFASETIRHLNVTFLLIPCPIS